MIGVSENLWHDSAGYTQLCPTSTGSWDTVLDDDIEASERAATTSKPRTPIEIKMGGGPRVPYPKHVWSPAGGWYAQPNNWKANTAIFGLAIFGITAMVWKLSADREYRHKMPEPGRFYPSRYWSKQIIEHERAQKEKGLLEKSE